MRRLLKCAAILGMAVLAAGTGFAADQMPGQVKVATVKTAAPATVARGGKGTLTVTLAIAPQFHVNAHTLKDPDLIPTALTATAPAGVKYGPIRYPKPHTLRLAGTPSPVYTGRTIIAVPFTVLPTAKPGRMLLQGELTYQGCNATSCYPPQTQSVVAAVIVK